MEAISFAHNSALSEEVRTGTLYLCFEEHKLDGTIAYVIQAIALNEVLSSSSPLQGLRQVAYTCGGQLPVYMGFGVFGSKIVLAGGTIGKLDPVSGAVEPYPSRDVYFFETNPLKDPNPSIMRSGITLLEGKPNPLLVELSGGRLCVLANYPMNFAGRPLTPSFEIIEPSDEDLSGGVCSSLQEPPHFSRHLQSSRNSEIPSCEIPDPMFALYSIVGNCIFSEYLFSPTYRFDTYCLNNGWEEFDKSRKFSCRSLAVLDGNDYWVIFDCGYPPDIAMEVHLMSCTYDSVVHLKEPSQLPASVLPPGFIPSEYRFVHLGGRRVCLVLSSFAGPFSAGYISTIERMKVVTIPFEFDVIRKDDCLDVHVDYWDAATHVLDYNTKRAEEYESSTSHACMLGAFLL